MERENDRMASLPINGKVNKTRRITASELVSVEMVGLLITTARRRNDVGNSRLQSVKAVTERSTDGYVSSGHLSIRVVVIFSLQL